MPSLSELRAELKELRKSSLGEKPVSRMKKGDISEQIEHLRRMRGETPAAAAVPSAPLRKSKAAVESIKEAKMSEFPVMPAPRVTAPKAPSLKASAPSAKKMAAAAPKKPSKMDRLMRMLEEMSDDE